MKKLSLLVVVVFTAFQAVGQSGWLTNLKLAQTAAKNNNQLILIDFWATWCGPCKQMDADVWSQPEVAMIKRNFVPVKIDVDAERTLASHYNVQSIPMLILMDYEGTSIHSYVGYKGKQDLLDFISKIPSDAKDLNEMVAAHDSKSETYESTRDVALALQMMSSQTDYEPLMRAFLIQSDRYLKRASKLANDQNKAVETELLLSLNNVLRGLSKKAIKSILEEMERFTSTEPALTYYILAKAYKSLDDQASYDEYKAKLLANESGSKYMAMLD